MRIFGLAIGLMCGVAVGQGVPAVVAVPGAAPQAKEVEKKPSDPAAAKMVFQAALFLRQSNLDEAQKQLDAAKGINDQELRLWSTYAALLSARGDKAGAIEDDKKELELHPDATEVYGALADLQESLGRRAEEEATLREGVKIEPRSPQAAARLVTMLVDDGKAAEAVTLGQDAVTRFTDVAAKEPRLNPRAVDGLEYQLSKAQMAAGMKTEALATIVALLKVTTNPSVLNDGAYMLAEANTELPLAEKSARVAVAQAELNSRRLSVYTKPDVSRVVVGQVTAVWDTMGWTLFREGKLDDAESYVRSAWLQRQGVEVGEHLAEIEIARGDKNKALTVCELSLAAAQKPAEVKAAEPKATDPKAVDTKLSAEMQAAVDARAAEAAKSAAADLAKLQQTADGLRKAGAVSKGQAGLKEMLTFPIPPLKKVSGSGEFVVLLGFGIVEEATGTSKTNAAGMLMEMQAMKVGTGLWPPGSGARLVMKASVNCAKACVIVMADF